jgi:hypothetical protein
MQFLRFCFVRVRSTTTNTDRRHRRVAGRLELGMAHDQRMKMPCLADIVVNPLADLAGAIPTENCWGVAAHLPVRDFEDIFTATFPAWNDPYYLCADYLVLEIGRILLFGAQSVTKIDFVFDRQGKVGKHYKVHYDLALKPMSLSVLPFLGECRHEDKQDFLPLQAADMNAAWVRRQAATIQLWTTADPFLSNFQQLDFKVERSWLEKMAKYRNEHAEEIKAYWDRRLGRE